MIHVQYLIMATVHAVAARWRSAAADDRGELNSNVAWAGLMLVVAVSVAGIVKIAVEGAANRFNFGF
jgi:hypothetical protein